MSVVTKTGDKGETGIIGKRISKADQLIKTIGIIDEVNSYLGICGIKLNAESKKLCLTSYALSLELMQKDLFTINAILAGAEIDWKDRGSERLGSLEKEIDKMEGKLPVLQNFILPGGSELSAHLMYARSLVRHAERELVLLLSTYYFLPSTAKILLAYINRLSDYFFILARWVNFKKGVKEVVWKI